MSKTLIMSGALPADEAFNGLDSYALTMNKGDRVAVMCVFECTEVRDTKKGYVRKVELTRNEPLWSPGAMPPAVAKAIAEAQQARTGTDPLPFDMVVPPAKHPDVCDHRWFIERDNLADLLADVPVGKVRKTCSRCSFVRYDDMDPDELADAEAEAIARETDPDSLADRFDDVAAVVPMDADQAVLVPFAKRDRT